MHLESTNNLLLCKCKLLGVFAEGIGRSTRQAERQIVSWAPQSVVGGGQVVLRRAAHIKNSVERRERKAIEAELV